MLAATTVGVVGSPLIITAAIASDLVMRRRRLPTVRVALFAIQYAINDSVEILVAPVLWLLAGFGARLDHLTSIRRHERLQAWSVGVMARRAERLLGIRLDIEQGAVDALTPGPVIVLCRHINIVDASLPALIYQRLGYRIRGVIMAELLADPGFDLIYRRTGSVFIPRDNGPEALALMRHLHDGIDRSTAVVIFPEGRLFRPELLTRFLAKLDNTNPERGRRLAGLRHVLPPRPGGVIALLDSIPHADVVTIAHAGLDQYGSFADLARAAPLDDPITVTAWRTPATDIPIDTDDRVAWLDEQWVRVDQWIHDHTTDPGPRARVETRRRAR
ncbi:MAG: 1-acyl-sn-glycerol-3-phosphate acyltransferase [Ilumatobacteraceae bacterium]